MCAKCLPSGGAKPCSATVIAWKLTKEDDPIIQLQIDHVRQWLSIWKDADTSFRNELAEAWRIQLRVLQFSTHRWQMVKGPASATIAILLDLGWDPQVPTMWVAPGRKTEAFIDPTDPYNTQQILQTLSQQILRAVWAAAASHQGGGGLEGGPPDLGPAKKARAKLIRDGHHDAAKALDHIICGGVSLGTARKRAHRVKTLTKVDSAASRLYKTGVKPQALFGSTAIG